MAGPQVGATCEPCPHCGDLTVKVATKDGKPVKHAVVDIDGEMAQSIPTDANGVAEFSEILKGPYNVMAFKENYAPGTTVVEGPAEDSLTVNTGPNQLNLTLTPVVKIVELVQIYTHKGTDHKFPKPGERVQYINLDETIDPDLKHREYGRCLKFKAKVGAANDDPNASLSGHKVYFYCTAGGNNRPGLSGTEKAGFDSEGSGVMKERGVTTDAGGWTPIVKFFLSVYGGDEFTVYATVESDYTQGEHAGPYKVWRMIFYDILEMKKPDGVNKFTLDNVLMTRVKAGFDKVFIKLEDTRYRHIADYKENFDAVDKGFKWADKYCSNKCVPLKIHFCVIANASPLGGPYGATVQFEEDDADKVLFTCTNKIIPYDFVGHKWFVSAEYKEAGSPVWNALDESQVSLDMARGWRSLIVDFTGTGVTPTPAAKVKVRVTYLKAFNAGGWGGSNCLHLLICRGMYEDFYPLANANNQIVVVCLHEPGHAMGLVNPSEPWHYPVTGHEWHCNFNTCTMWYQSNPGNEAFHDERMGDPGCATFIRGKELTKSKMEPSWNYPRSMLARLMQYLWG